MFTEHCLETLLERMKMFRYLVGDEAEQVIFGRGSCVCTRSEQQLPSNKRYFKKSPTNPIKVLLKNLTWVLIKGPQGARGIWALVLGALVTLATATTWCQLLTSALGWGE